MAAEPFSVSLDLSQGSDISTPETVTPYSENRHGARKCRREKLYLPDQPTSPKVECVVSIRFALLLRYSPTATQAWRSRRQKRRFAVPCPGCRFGGPSRKPNLTNSSASRAPRAVQTNIWSNSMRMRSSLLESSRRDWSRRKPVDAR
jgi:hypothetical protein